MNGSGCRSTWRMTMATHRSSSDCRREWRSRGTSRLSAPGGDALELRIVKELSYEEVAERLEIRPAAARLRVSRALRRLAVSVPEEKS